MAQVVKGGMPTLASDAWALGCGESDEGMSSVQEPWWFMIIGWVNVTWGLYVGRIKWGIYVGIIICTKPWLIIIGDYTWGF